MKIDKLKVLIGTNERGDDFVVQVGTELVIWCESTEVTESQFIEEIEKILMPSLLRNKHAKKYMFKLVEFNATEISKTYGQN